MKFLNFFKTTLGIAILILAIIAIIVTYLNWDTIKTWWNTDTTDEGPDETPADNTDRLSDISVARENVCNDVGADCSFTYTDPNGVVITIEGKKVQGRSGCKCLIELPASSSN